MSAKRLGIVGLGKAAGTIHLPAYRKIRSLEVVGGVDPAVAGADFAFPLFGSVAELLAETRPDVLAVVTPPRTHFDLIRQGLEAGCHVFCEKPFVSTMEEARTIIELSRESERWVVINNQWRFMEIHARAKDLIGSREFGSLLFVTAQQTFHMTADTEAGWRGELGNRRTCIEFGTHVLDLCRFFFDEDPSTITARMPRGADSNGPDLLNLLQLEFSGDRVAHITLDRLSRGPHRYLQFRLDGSEGCIETSLGGGIEIKTGVHGGTRRPFMEWDVSMGGRARLYHGEKFRKFASDPIDVFATATSRLMKAFLESLDAGTEPPCHADDNRKTLALMLAAYESHERNAPVEMRYG